MDFIEIKNICSSYGTFKKTKMHARYYEQLSNGKNIFERWFASRICSYIKKNLNIKLFEQALYKIYISITSKLMKRYSTSLVIKEMQLKLRQAPKPGHVEQGNRDG